MCSDLGTTYYSTTQRRLCKVAVPMMMAGDDKLFFLSPAVVLAARGVGCWDENGGCWRCFLPLQLLQLPSPLFSSPQQPPLLHAAGETDARMGWWCWMEEEGERHWRRPLFPPCPLLCGSIIEKPPCPLACDDLPLICFFAGAVKGCHAVMHCHAVQLLLLHVHLHGAAAMLVQAGGV